MTPVNYIENMFLTNFNYVHFKKQIFVQQIHWVKYLYIIQSRLHSMQKFVLVFEQNFT